MPRSAAASQIPFGDERVQAAPCAPTASSACNDGRYAILDYKTGAPPTEKQVRTGLSPQLTLEAAILRQGGFKDIPGGRIGRRARLCAAARRRPRRRSRCRSSSRTARPTSRPTCALAQLAGVRRQVRRPGHALSLAAASDVDDALRRLRPSRAREGMVADRRRRRRRAVRMSKPRDIPPAVIERQTHGVRPGQLGLGRGQCRLRQDPCAGAARDPAAARRRRSGANPLPHLHQGRRRQHGEPRVRTLCGHGPCSTTRRSTTPCAKTGEQRIDAKRRAARAAAVRAGAGDAGRPEGADHPRLLHPAAAPVPVRGQCRGALRGARRDRGDQLLEQLSLDVLLEAAGEPDSPLGRALASADSRRRRPDVPRPGARGDPPARRADALGRGRRRRAAGDGAAFAARSASRPDETIGAGREPRSSTAA